MKEWIFLEDAPDLKDGTTNFQVIRASGSDFSKPPSDALVLRLSAVISMTIHDTRDASFRGVRLYFAHLVANTGENYVFIRGTPKEIMAHIAPEGLP